LVLINNKKQTKPLEQFANDNNIIDYDENIAYISTGLTLYYSVFSDSSYNPKKGNNGDLRKWYNISPYFKNIDGSSCSAMQFNESHMNFFNTPTYSREDGIMLGNNYITGPMSYTLGISGNTQYSIFIFVKFMSISPSKNDIELFQIFGNTQNLNGIRLFMTGNNTDAVSKDISGCNMYLEIGANTPLQCVKEGSRNIMFQHNKSYLFVMTNNNSNIKLSLFDGLNGNKIELINSPVSSQMYDISFSNKYMIINQYQNVNGNIYTYGVYNKVLTDNDMLNIQKHLFSQIKILDPVVIEKDKIIETLKSDIVNIKACPYDKDTCNACSSVTDWTNINAIMTTKDTYCLDAINQFCNENPSHYLCKCWNSNDNSYTSSQCTNYRNIYTKKTCTDVDNLDKTDLSKIKSKYSLCSCQEETINLQPLKIPDISKFKIPTNISTDNIGESCTDKNNNENIKISEVENSKRIITNMANNSTNPLYSGYSGDMSEKIINFFNTVGNPGLNTQSLVNANAQKAKAAIKPKIPDYFEDMTINKQENKENNIKMFWK
jgi:hypothetical protein